jgi:SAM-dependent methyltransferase
MDAETYYRDHWVAIEPERVERYKKMFTITDANRRVWLGPLGTKPGETVVDFGCGPGAVTVELADLVGPGGFVHGVDLNEDLLVAARELAEERGVADRVAFHHATDARIPLPDASADRVVCKSVLLYVPDIDATLADACRVLRPGGTLATQDSDFGLSACTAFRPEEWSAFLDAARPAFRDPTMGRNLRAAVLRAGLQDVSIAVTALVDDRGFFRGTLENFFGYVRTLGTMPEPEVDAMAARADQAIAAGDWLFVLNFFHVLGVRP